MITASGLFTSWATPAAIVPSAASRSAYSNRRCSARRSLRSRKISTTPSALWSSRMGATLTSSGCSWPARSTSATSVGSTFTSRSRIASYSGSGSWPRSDVRPGRCLGAQVEHLGHRLARRPRRSVQPVSCSARPFMKVMAPFRSVHSTASPIDRSVVDSQRSLSRTRVSSACRSRAISSADRRALDLHRLDHVPVGRAALGPPERHLVGVGAQEHDRHAGSDRAAPRRSGCRRAGRAGGCPSARCPVGCSAAEPMASSAELARPMTSYPSSRRLSSISSAMSVSSSTTSILAPVVVTAVIQSPARQHPRDLMVVGRHEQGHQCQA